MSISKLLIEKKWPPDIESRTVSSGKNFSPNASVYMVKFA
jgi:hypothetical protein